MIYYFAYGSNLHPVRLIERVSSAKLIGKVVLTEHVLVFHKRGVDESGKCSICKTGEGADVVYGALYQLNPAHKSDLDRFESKGSGYIDTQVLIEHNGAEYECFTYIAQQSHIEPNLKPFDWYKDLVILGAKYLGFPEGYVSEIERIESVEDFDRERRDRHNALIGSIRSYR